MNKQPFILILLLSIILLPISANAKPLNDAEILDLLRNGFVVPIHADEVEIKKQLGQPIQTKDQVHFEWVKMRSKTHKTRSG